MTAEKEVYRSFEGKLGVDNRTGYIIYELNDYYEIEILNVWSDVEDVRFRVVKDDLPDFDNADRIDKLLFEIEHGARAGQIFFRGKWYSQDTINKIQCTNKDHDWKRYVK